MGNVFIEYVKNIHRKCFPWEPREIILSPRKYEQVSIYLKILRNAFLANYENVYTVHAITETPLLIGTKSLFASTIQNIGLSWDPLFDVPYIPSSSIRGAIHGAIERARDRSLCDVLFSIKGTSPLIVSDAYPVSSKNAITCMDVITPTYEGDEKFMEHKAFPTPIKFISISEGVEFCFLIAKRRKHQLNMEKVKRYIYTALTRIGIGAKTSSGYGISKEVWFE